jgi:hypothetical protein
MSFLMACLELTDESSEDGAKEGDLRGRPTCQNGLPLLYGEVREWLGVTGKQEGSRSCRKKREPQPDRVEVCYREGDGKLLGEGVHGTGELSGNAESLDNELVRIC